MWVTSFTSSSKAFFSRKALNSFMEKLWLFKVFRLLLVVLNLVDVRKFMKRLLLGMLKTKFSIFLSSKLTIWSKLI